MILEVVMEDNEVLLLPNHLVEKSHPLSAADAKSWNNCSASASVP
jgi:hypothetical protein